MTGVEDQRPRIPLLDVEDMNAEQRRLHDSVVSGPRGQMIGPLRAAIHSPELASAWSALGEFLRYRTCLPPRLNELAIIVTGRRWTAQVEWWVHARAAVVAGLRQEIVDAIAALESPDFDDDGGVRGLRVRARIAADRSRAGGHLQRRAAPLGRARRGRTDGRDRLLHDGVADIECAPIAVARGRDRSAARDDLVTLPPGRHGSAS